MTVPCDYCGLGPADCPRARALTRRLPLDLLPLCEGVPALRERLADLIAAGDALAAEIESPSWPPHDRMLREWRDARKAATEPAPHFDDEEPSLAAAWSAAQDERREAHRAAVESALNGYLSDSTPPGYEPPRVSFVAPAPIDIVIAPDGTSAGEAIVADAIMRADEVERVDDYTVRLRADTIADDRPFFDPAAPVPPVDWTNLSAGPPLTPEGMQGAIDAPEASRGQPLNILPHGADPLPPGLVAVNARRAAERKPYEAPDARVIDRASASPAELAAMDRLDARLADVTDPRWVREMPRAAALDQAKRDAAPPVDALAERVAALEKYLAPCPRFSRVHDWREGDDNACPCGARRPAAVA